MDDLDQVRAIVTEWTNGPPTRNAAALAMYRLARLLEIEPPKPVAGKRVKRSDEDL